MPGWNLHVHFANELVKKYCVKNPIDFIVGSVFPDCPWLDVGTATMSGFRDRLHFYHGRKGMFNGEAGISEWFDSYRGYLTDSDFHKGMLSHVILDNQINMLWNTVAVMDGFDMVSLADGSVVTQDGAAHAKWEELNHFDMHKYHNVDVFSVYQKYSMTDVCFDLIMNDYGLTKDEVYSIIPAVDGCVNNISYKEDFKFIVPTITYERILYITENIWYNMVSLWK